MNCFNTTTLLFFCIVGATVYCMGGFFPSECVQAGLRNRKYHLSACLTPSLVNMIHFQIICTWGTQAPYKCRICRGCNADVLQELHLPFWTLSGLWTPIQLHWVTAQTTATFIVTSVRTSQYVSHCIQMGIPVSEFLDMYQKFNFRKLKFQ